MRLLLKASRREFTAGVRFEIVFNFILVQKMSDTEAKCAQMASGNIHFNQKLTSQKSSTLKKLFLTSPIDQTMLSFSFFHGQVGMNI